METTKTHVCPWWVGYLLASPLRKLIQDPEKILKPYVKENMKVLDFGCAMGYFSLAMAKMVGENGKVICIDLQEKMLKELRKRVKKFDYENRVKLKQCSQDNTEISTLINLDFALAFAVIHEMPHQKKFLRETYDALKNKGKLLIADPKGHVSKENFDITIKEAVEVGFKIIDYPKISKSMSVLLEK